MGVGGGRVHICSDNSGKNTVEARIVWFFVVVVVVVLLFPPC